MINIPQIESDLKADEGFRDCVYQCSAGANTIGYGFNLDTNKMPESVASMLLRHGIAECIADCERLAWFYSLNGNRKAVIINMMFNLGSTRLCGFKRMIAALEAKDYELAADEMMESRWAVQVGSRAIRLSEEMRKG